MPIITLTTDIGQGDFIVGAIKGQLLTVNPGFTIVDISHQLSPFNYLQTAYVCNNAFKYYPPNTFHVVLVNVFEKPAAHLLIARFNNQFIACPDNGIITMIAGYKPAKVVAAAVPQNKTLGILDITREIANIAGKLQKGATFSSLGSAAVAIEEKYPLRCTAGPDWIEGQIIFIDNFENVVVNITESEFEEFRKGRRFKIVFTRNEVIDSLSQNYSSVMAGEKLAWFNSAGYLEIAVNKGNMAGLFGLQGFSESAYQQQNIAMQHKWLYQTVRVFFE